MAESRRDSAILTFEVSTESEVRGYEIRSARLIPRQLELVLRMLHVDRVTDDAAKHTTGDRADDCSLDPVAAHDRAEHTTRRRPDDGVALGVTDRLTTNRSRRVDAAARGRPPPSS